MDDDAIQWTKAAKAIGGLAAVLVLLAHFVHPALPLTAVRVELLLLLIGVLLGLDMVTEHFPVQVAVEAGSDDDSGDDTED